MSDSSFRFRTFASFQNARQVCIAPAEGNRSAEPIFDCIMKSYEGDDLQIAFERGDMTVRVHDDCFKNVVAHLRQCGWEHVG